MHVANKHKEKQTIGTTSEFIKLHSTKTPKVGELNIDCKTALAKTKKGGKLIVTCWSNGDACGYCTTAEKCLMQTAAFKDWIAKQDAYFVFQYSGDKDKGAALHDWIFKKSCLKQYPGFRVTLYKADGKIAVDKAITGNDLRKSKTGASEAKNTIVERQCSVC